MAAVVPIVGAIGLWLVTGSILSLWLAALGPLIAVATLADAARSARRDRRLHHADATRVQAEVAQAVARRHDEERRRAWARHPDVASFLARDDEVWRRSPDRDDVLVIGEGEIASDVRITGGEGDARAIALRARSSRLSHAPVIASLHAGVVVVGNAVIAAAVQRALVIQLCLALPPGDLAIVGPLTDGLAWMEALPHRVVGAPRRLAVVLSGETVPSEADIVIACSAPGDPLPPQCGTVITARSPDSATVERGGEVSEVSVEALAVEQAAAVAAMLAERAERVLGLRVRDSGPVTLADLAAPVDLAAVDASRSGLAAVIGLEGREPAVVDLVADGPHAVVAGVTGSGKSELLITWILALCRTRSTREVTFLLADFKGGTAFDSLARVPHVTGVITDLDGAGARRAIESLRAEVRWREGELAAAGARDILDPRVALPRLVVVVDEFAALLGDHPELHAVFADVAARGRALGIHLVLGTQRAAGVIRDSLLANCPLRISLRVTDAADSRSLLGTDEAALLPGGAEGRGHALLRRAGDARPRPVRVALSGPSDIDAAAARGGDERPRRPWLPGLPPRLSLAELAELSPTAVNGEVLLLGLADEPHLQRQRAATLRIEDRGLLVLGGPGAGLTNAVALAAAQAPSAVMRIPAAPEPMWDAIATLAAEPPPPGSLVCIDDLDAVAMRLPPDYAQVAIERIEELVRRAGSDGVLILASAHRLAGAVARIADLFPKRLLLPFPTRTEHIAAGGDPAAFVPGAPPGRGVLDGTALQVALAPRLPSLAPDPSPDWCPSAPLTAFATRRSPAARAALDEWERRGVRSVSVDGYAADPAVTADGPVVVVGEPDDWQRHWRLLADARGDHDLVVDTSCAAEFRLLTGARTLPPYCESGRGRAWLISAGGDAVRIVLPSAEVRPNRPRAWP
ncbi:FtsK/SpoIIIE domain-containing protein [Microbacterium gallinarum]|uniref:Cell division protein FtsK n=1 Tax=Microbacterium gallinarum TaxID=2762209 RepID=A0ABR8WYY3_9MICO|nr:FtsK/SpoIIIE domain-containing protein [Microbacterium gallinarum]MBD8022092.1 cell division protein FtsK [Microbacterium gallinarum]